MDIFWSADLDFI